MLNYICAEFYKVFRRKYTWIALVILMVLEALLAGGFIFINAHGSHVNFSEGATTMCTVLSTGCFFALLTCDMVYADQDKYSTLKNEVSFGIPRLRIYFGKYIAQLSLSVLYCVIMVVFYLALCWFCLYQDPENALYALQVVGYCLLTALPIWTGVQMVCCASSFLSRNNLTGTLAAFGLFWGLPSLAEFVGKIMTIQNSEDVQALGLKIVEVCEYTPAAMINAAGTVVGDWRYFGTACAVGAFWFVLAAVLGVIGFSRKEIK